MRDGCDTPRCAGIDCSKKDAKVCVRIQGQGRRAKSSRVTTWGATTAQILALREHLVAANVSCVVIESTSDYWKPFYYLLDDALEVTLVNATAVRNLPGRKTDVSDAAWPADLGTHGLVKASFVPPAPVRELRDLTRTRTRTVGHVSALGLIGRKTPEALAKAVNAIQHYLVTETRLKIPAIFHNDAIASGRDRRARDAPPPRKWPRTRPNNGNSQRMPTFTGGPQHR